MPAQNIAVYDFCSTIVSFETADEFIHYIRSGTARKRMVRTEKARLFLNRTKLMAIFELLRHKMGIEFSLNKKMVLSELKGMSREEINLYARSYYEERIKPKLIPEIVNLLTDQKKHNYKIVIVSAAYEPYLRYFAEEYAVDELITNIFLYDEKDRFTGRLAQDDCKGMNKLKRLRERIPDLTEYSTSYAYGDSESDHFVLEAVDNGVVVSHNSESLWNKKYRFKEITWI